MTEPGKVWWVLKATEKEGPYTSAELEAKISADELNDDARIWREGLLSSAPITDATNETWPYRAVADANGCFVAGTLVHTKNGLIPIEKISVGNWVLSQPEMKGDQAYRRVTKTMVFDDKEVISIDVFREGERIGFVVTRNHPFWLKNVGWTSANRLDTGDELELIDGSSCEVINVAALYPTDIDGIGWMDGIFHCYRGDGLGRTVDLRNDSVKFNYEEIPYPGKSYSEIRTFLKSKVFNIEVEGFHTYYVGEWGVWVHNTNW